MSLKGDMMFTKARRSLTVIFALLLGLGLLGACAPAPAVTEDSSFNTACKSAGYVKSLRSDSKGLAYDLEVDPPYKIQGPNSKGQYSVSYRLAGKTTTRYHQVPPPTNYWGSRIRYSIANGEGLTVSEINVMGTIPCQREDGVGVTIAVNVSVWAD